MNDNAFRHFYDYHFSENRTLWDSYVTQLSHEQFTQSIAYSHGSKFKKCFFVPLFF